MNKGRKTLSLLGMVTLLLFSFLITDSTQVQAKEKEKEKVRLSHTSLVVSLSDEVPLKILGADKKKVKWTTSDYTVVNVCGSSEASGVGNKKHVRYKDYSGKYKEYYEDMFFSPYDVGTCTITAEVDGKKYTCKMTVIDKIKGVAASSLHVLNNDDSTKFHTTWVNTASMPHPENYEDFVDKYIEKYGTACVCGKCDGSNCSYDLEMLYYKFLLNNMFEYDNHSVLSNYTTPTLLGDAWIPPDVSCPSNILDYTSTVSSKTLENGYTEKTIVFDIDSGVDIYGDYAVKVFNTKGKNMLSNKKVTIDKGELIKVGDCKYRCTVTITMPSNKDIIVYWGCKYETCKSSINSSMNKAIKDYAYYFSEDEDLSQLSAVVIDFDIEQFDCDISELKSLFDNKSKNWTPYGDFLYIPKNLGK